MTNNQPLIDKINALPPEGQKRVIEFIDSLAPAKSAEASNGDVGGSNIWKRLSSLGREMEQLPTELPDDLAKNHDHYLHGKPKLP